ASTQPRDPERANRVLPYTLFVNRKRYGLGARPGFWQHPARNPSRGRSPSRIASGSDFSGPVRGGLVMRRRIPVSLVVGCALVPAMSGCETTGQQTRKTSHSDIPLISSDEPPKKEPAAEPGTAEGNRGFFKPGRLSGAWSSEGAEIE